MRKATLKFLAILTIASPLALAACHNSDEHPGDNAGGASGSEHTDGDSSGSTSEHPGG